jgi:hypothetical protein
MRVQQRLRMFRPPAGCSRHTRRQIEDLLQIDRAVRDQVEIKESANVAEEIVQRLPRNESEIESLIGTGYRLAANMSWDVIVKDYLLSGLQKTSQKVPAL